MTEVADQPTTDEQDVSWGSTTEVEVLILGAGVSGIAVGARCLQAGVRDVVLIERSAGPGGTWRHHTYPGCAVDIPSHVYSFSWAPNPSWPRLFATQPDVKDYIESAVESSGISSHIRYGVEVLDATWNDQIHRWQVTTTQGAYLARHFVAAAGPLHEPMIPDLPGREEFAGESFHSSSWPADLDLTGRKVVVIGTGASALQFVPAIQPDVAQMTVLQRTPSWVMPKLDWNTTRFERGLLRRVPALIKPYRNIMWAVMDVFLGLAMKHPRFARAMGLVGKWHMRRTIKDRSLRKALTPDYAPTCKRLGLSNNFYQAIAAPNVELVTAAASRLRSKGVETVDGRFIEADVVIFGTGFHTIQSHPVNTRIRGRYGVTLADLWHGSPTAYLGTTVSGFPNLYWMFGPNAGTLSGFVMAEAQAEYIVGAVQTMLDHGWSSIDVRPEEQADFVRRADEVLSKSTFAVGGCSSYYLAADGDRVTLVWPGSMRNLQRSLADFDAAPYEVERVAVAASLT